MKLYKHEQIIKEKMQSFQPEIDKDALWDSLAHQVPDTAKKRKRRLGFFLFLIFLAIGLAGVVVLEKNDKNPTRIDQLNKQRNESKQKNTEKINNLPHEASEKILALLEQFQLPLLLPDEIQTKTIIDKLQRDKKFSGGNIKFVLLTSLGNAEVSSEVSLDDIRESIEHLRS